jgi:1-acyl-sn-glycerol-3-phosphate acyltransferase
MMHIGTLGTARLYLYSLACRQRSLRLSFFRKLFRLALVSFDFAYEIVWVFFNRPKTRAERAAWLTRLTRRVMRTINLTFTTVGPVPMSGAVISNHLTFFDIFFHAALRPCVFVSKIELRKMPLLGWISMMSGTVYVARGGGGSAAKAAEGMGQGFRDGLPVVFFPEGTTGVDSSAIMTFRTGLLAQAIMLEQPIVCAYIHYELSAVDLAAGKTPQHDFYWGRQSLPRLIWDFLGLHRIHGIIQFGEHPVAFSPEAIANRKIAAEEARAAMLALAGLPADSPPPLPEFLPAP